MKEMNREEADKLYGFSKWGEGFFDINANGELVVLPKKNKDGAKMAIPAIVREMEEMGIEFPAVIRFHDILRFQVKNLNKTFRKVIEEAEYQGRYVGVYPVKVNQMREVVEEILDAGSSYDYGLEAGSKSELLCVLAHNTNRNSLTILNGYKDDDYLRLALLGTQLDRKVVVVIEKYSELISIIRLSKELKIRPIIGIRGKLSVKGVGRWKNSSGDRAKFGLSISEIVRAVQYLKENGYDDCFKLFHFHIGSQISNIRSIKDAISEGVRIYCELFKMGINLEYFDVGGGLGVDYDGSKSNTDSSKNYNLQEYVSDIVYGLAQACDLEGVPHPNIVSESGRAITAHHSCVITNTLGCISPTDSYLNTKKLTGEHHLVSNMRELITELGTNNFQEVYNDARQLRDEILSGFKLGVVTLEGRAVAETLYWEICERIVTISKIADFIPDSLKELEETLYPQYLCNFSVFQSTADTWAIKQVLPIMPISRLNEFPSVNASIADITCDSDGKIDKFISDDGSHKSVPLHQLKENEAYYLGIFLTGAYQDVMGDMHNLFGRLNEVHVFSDDDDPTDFYIEEVIYGNSASQVLKTMQYNPSFMSQTVKKSIDKQVGRGKLSPREGVRLVDFYEYCLRGYTYYKTKQ